MGLKQIDKIHILEILRHSIDDIYYNDFFNLSHHSKYSISELLEYLVALGNNELQKEKNLSNKTFAKICYSISLILRYSDENTTIDSILIGKIKALSTAYQQFLEEYSCNKDSLIEKSLIQMNEILDTYYPINSRQIISDFAMKNDDLSQQLKDYEAIFEKLRQDNTLLQNNLNEKSGELTTLKIALDQCKKKSLKFETLQQENASLQKDLNESKEQMSILKTDLEKAKKDSLHFEIQYNSLNEEKQKKQKEEAKSQIIQEILIETLYSKDASLEELKQIFEQQQIVLSENEIYRHIQLLKNKFSIQGPTFSAFPPVYQISKETESGLIFPISIPQNKKEINMLLVSDFHLSLKDDSFFEDMDMLYRYCSSHHIPYIFNLGDLIDGVNDDLKTISLENLKKLENLIERISTEFPKTNDIYHGFLGGNHDKICCSYGIDLFQELAENRNDFIPLGYDYSFICFQNSLDMITLHHPNVKFTDSFHIMDNSIEPSHYLNNFYNKLMMDRKNVYMDFLGHIHRYILNTKDAYCFVPSYFHDRFFNSALHLKLEFDSKNRICSLVIYPLAPKQSLIPTGEIIYQRARK